MLITEQHPVQPLVDEQARKKALTLAGSFIVQAPAGSGKTELLMRRYLSLLAQACKAPEEIVAITFTRKAAAEMRSRVLNALSGDRPDKLASAVIARDKTEGWQLLDNPNRLRITTIDAFCASLTQQVPLLSQLAPNAHLSEDPTPLYQRAVHELLEGLHTHKSWTEPLSDLLLHLDNNVNRLERLLMTMLARRDQWLPHIAGVSNIPNEYRHTALRQRLEAGLQAVLTDKLNDYHTSYPEHLRDEMSAMEDVAGYNNADPQTLARFYLTTAGEVRKTVTQAQGFIAPSSVKDKDTREHLKQMKQRMLDLLGLLKKETVFIERIVELIKAPNPTYTDAQWQILDALLTLLPLLAAHLNIIFNQHNTTDFSAVTQAAITALGTPDNPSDLALGLDYQIQHLLVDEFQDTSLTQFRLLEQLIAGWLPNDGHSLFLVGDPMQSIYRFRQAEVGLFLQVQQHGIGQLRLQPLVLSTNFRSTASLIRRINEVFYPLFPSTEAIDISAIPYKSSVAFSKQDSSLNVNALDCHLCASDDEQALLVTDLIQQTLRDTPTATIAVLVRSRTHLAPLLPALQNAGIHYHGVDIEPLAAHPIVQDIHSLTRALLHLGDRIAWLSILRAPWCALSLADLHALAGGHHQNTILWERLMAWESDAQLSEKARSQLARIVPILDATLAHYHRLPIVDWVQGCWEALGGPACINSEADADKAAAYFDFLRKLSADHTTLDLNYLDTQLKNLYAPSPNTHANTHVQIMTLHKAKGLEFDRVILPGLARTTRHDTHPLLRWMERVRDDGETDLLLAPITQTGERNDSIYDYLAHIESKRAEHELIRLLYVAATRAKQKLDLVATFTPDMQTPNERSPLAKFWELFNSQ